MSDNAIKRYSDITNSLSFWVERIWHLPSAVYSDGEFPAGLIRLISDDYDSTGGIRRIFPDLKLGDDADRGNWLDDGNDIIKEHLRRCLFLHRTHTGFLLEGRAAGITARKRGDRVYHSINYSWMAPLLGYGATYDEAFADLTEQVKAYREEEKAEEAHHE